MKAMAELERGGETPAQRFTLREAARILEVPEARLRALARAGLLDPQRGPIGLPSFGFQDLLLLRTTKGLLDSGVPMPKIRRIWASLRHQLSADVPLTSVAISTDGETVVASDGSTRWRPESGQMLLDFDVSEIASKVEEAAIVAPPAPPTLRLEVVPPRVHEPLDEASLSAEDWYEHAAELEADSPEQALRAYEQAVDLDPGHAEAHLNLGRMLHLAGDRGRAEPHYREAVKLDSADPTPHFNLGVLLDEIGRKDEAILAYRQAIKRDPDFADAHCNLGLLLESLGRRQEAVKHLMAARERIGAEE
jgi:tetratricopeptide (TPR) repeat protein